MLELEEQVNQLINQILLKAENQHELLIGQCRSQVKLTNTQEHILMLLSEGRKTNSELAKTLNVSQAAVTKAVKTLVKEGMLEAKKDKDDGRVTYFVLTQEAQPIAQEQEEHHQETLGVYRSVLDQFDNQERQVIGRFLNMCCITSSSRTSNCLASTSRSAINQLHQMEACKPLPRLRRSVTCVKDVWAVLIAARPYHNRITPSSSIMFKASERHEYSTFPGYRNLVVGLAT